MKNEVKDEWYESKLWNNVGRAVVLLVVIVVMFSIGSWVKKSGIESKRLEEAKYQVGVELIRMDNTVRQADLEYKNVRFDKRGNLLGCLRPNTGEFEANEYSRFILTKAGKFTVGGMTLCN